MRMVSTHSLLFREADICLSLWSTWIWVLWSRFNSNWAVHCPKQSSAVSLKRFVLILAAM